MIIVRAGDIDRTIGMDLFGYFTVPSFLEQIMWISRGHDSFEG